MSSPVVTNSLWQPCLMASQASDAQDGQLYGDGWTPLMAAAVADRHNIAVRLLSAAGGAVGTLVGHANRYGQTAVHIAARKGSLPLLTALLAIGGPIVATVSFIAAWPVQLCMLDDIVSCLVA